MAVTFTQARIVEAGQPLKAGDQASLAQAVNTRLVSGVGDMASRVAFYLFSGLFRKVRNDAGTLATNQTEFFNFYQELNPSDAQWPTAPEGEEAGANLANHLNAFVFGAEALSLASERDRLAQVVTTITPELGGDATAEDYWRLGKFQRGAYDINTGDYSSPMLNLGISYAYIRSSLTSPHGNSWGGYFPTAFDQGGCDPVGDYLPPNLEIYFTNLETGEVVSYCGTCPDANACPDDGDRVQWIAYTPFTYVVFLYDGSVDYYPKNKWIEGPYTTAARLSKASANALSRVVAQYVAEFRGSDEQRAQKDRGQPNAFPFQDFFTEQFPLAPQIGTTIGDSIAPFYPAFFHIGSDGLTFEAGPLRFSGGGQSFVAPAGSVSTHFLFAIRRVASSTVTVTIKDSGNTIATATLAPDANGNASRIVRIYPARRLENLTVECSDVTLIDSQSYVAAEFTCLLDYKPQISDAYSLLRLSTFTGGTPDGRGIDEEQSRTIYESLDSLGMCNPIATQEGINDGSVNGNAIFDAARRLSKCVRILPRHNIVGYAVTDSKSTLYLRRYAFGMDHGVPIDLLEGLAPQASAIVSGELVPGRVYEVNEGSIGHAGEMLVAGQTFTARSAEFTGTGLVREENGIYDAPPKGYSNKWCGFVTFKPYATADSSPWKPENFADIESPFIDRCTFDSLEIGLDEQVITHVGYGVKPVYISETMTGYRYVPTPNTGTNDDYSNRGADTDFVKSCRVYEPPLEVQSAVIDDQWSAEYGEQIICVKFHQRFHHHEDAPSSIDDDVSTWDLDALALEVAERRTDENGLREYIVHSREGRNCGNAGQGDAAYSSALPTSGDVFGTCYPNLFFVQLIPEPYLDGNTRYDVSDSGALSDHQRLVELYIRAGCEGFVDGRTSASRACEYDTTSLYDYTFENLCFDASDNRHVPLLPVTIREDNTPGHGPMPMTRFYAATHNALARAVNKLTSARLMLPATLEFKTDQYDGSIDITHLVKNAAGDSVQVSGDWSSSNASLYAIWHYGRPIETATLTEGSWFPGDATSCGSGLAIQSDGTTADLVMTRQTVQFRWAPDSPFEDVLPDGIADYVDRPALLLKTQILEQTYSLGWISGSDTGDQCHLAPLTSDTVWYDGVSQSVETTLSETVSDYSCDYDLEALVSSGDAPASHLTAAKNSGDFFPGTKDCGVESLRTISIEAINSATPAISIPTVAYSDGD
jgi:hypothetical protein